MTMHSLPFSKWNPSGNLTLLFPETLSKDASKLATRALHKNSAYAEQSGFYNLQHKTMRMAGGEFCVNATRSFGALLAWQKAKEDSCEGEFCEEEVSVRVSGWKTEIQLQVRGKAPLWDVTARLLVDEYNLEEKEGIYIVRLPGISHILINAAPECEKAKQIIEHFSLHTQDASGVIWWKQEGQQLSIVPVVYVRDIDTLYPENACGSGTLALALYRKQYFGEKKLSILQPSGEALAVDFQDKTVEIAGKVSLVAEGNLYFTEE